MTPETIESLNKIGATLSVPGVLLIAIFATWWVTQKHHKEVVSRMEREQERGWAEAAQARTELSANNAALDKVVDAVKDLTRSVSDLSGRLPGRR